MATDLLPAFKNPSAIDDDRLRLAIEHLPASAWIIDPQRQVIYANSSTRMFLGEQAIPASGSWQQLIHPTDLPLLTIISDRHRASHTPYQAEIRFRRHDGIYRWMSMRVAPVKALDGQFIGNVGVMQDVTESRNRDNALARATTHDHLTGLPNRAFVEGRLEAMISAGGAGGRPIPVLTFGVDRFQTINETKGHAAGDALLAEIGRRLAGVHRPQEIIGHLSGNRFVIVGEPLEDIESVSVTATRLLDLCREPVRLDDIPYEFSGSVGIAFFPSDGSSAQELMRAAEIGLQGAKQGGGNAFALFDREAYGKSRRRHSLETELRRAIPAGELVVYFQPKVALPDFRLAGFEALVRWDHPQRGLLMPGVFIPLAEETGLIHGITQWVIREVARQLKEWINAGLTPVPVAVNVCARDFLGAIETDLAIYAETGLPPELLEIEVTESTMIQNFDRVCSIVRNLMESGIKVALDDFGTGYSSLGNLNRLPISTLKIDRVFTRDVDWNRASRAVAAAIMSIAGELGLEVVAEGVETKEQLQALVDLNCKLIQGFLTGHPVPAEQAEKLLRAPFLLPLDWKQGELAD